MKSHPYYLLASLFLCLGISFNAKADVETALANICTIVMQDDKSELRKKMKNVRSNYSLKLADYYEGITCNGNSLIRTALLSNSIEAGTLLVKRMPKSKLNKPEADGTSLQDWIAQNQLNDSEIAKVVLERL